MSDLISFDYAIKYLLKDKAVFNTSRLIVDNLGTNQDYLKIKKVFHINLLYFPFSDTKSPLHHGKVIFHEIDKSHPVDFHLVDRGMNIFDLHNIFPEYFMISIPLFDDVIKQEIDEWLYLMKHSEVKESFKSPYMQKVAQRLNILKMSNAERNIYDSYIMESMKGRDYLVSAEERGRGEGIQIGKEEGMQLAKIEMAKKMLSLNIALDIVAETTGISMQELEKLQKE